MIITFRQFLPEAIEEVPKAGGGTIRVVINPSVTALQSITKHLREVRYLTQDGRLFVWNSRSEIHSVMAPKLGLDYRKTNQGYFMYLPKKIGFRHEGNWDHRDSRLQRYVVPFHITMR